jgi:transposase
MRDKMGTRQGETIAQLVQADEDIVRDVIHRFNEIGLACLDHQWAGGRPRLLNLDDEDYVVTTATTRPAKLGQPFTRWSLRKLAAYLRRVHGRVIRIGREALRRLLGRRGVTFQRTKTWKESPDPDRDTKLDRIEEVLDRFPRRTSHHAFATEAANQLDGPDPAEAVAGIETAEDAVRAASAARTKVLDPVPQHTGQAAIDALRALLVALGDTA